MLGFLRLHSQCMGKLFLRSAKAVYDTWINTEVLFEGSQRNSTVLSCVGFALGSTTPTDIGISEDFSASMLLMSNRVLHFHNTDILVENVSLSANYSQSSYYTTNFTLCVSSGLQYLPKSRILSPGLFQRQPSSCWCSVYWRRRSWNTTRMMLCRV